MLTPRLTLTISAVGQSASCCHLMGKYTGLTGSERAIMNNPWRQPGVDYHQHFPALKELNISIMEETFYPGITKSQEVSVLSIFPDILSPLRA
jgi:hypothetical protein